MEMGCSEIRLELDEVNVAKAFNRLEFQDHLIACYQIDPCSAHHFILKVNIYRKLRFEGYGSMC